MSATLGAGYIDLASVSFGIPKSPNSGNRSCRISYWLGLLDSAEQYLLQPVLEYNYQGILTSGGYAYWMIYSLMWLAAGGPYPRAPAGSSVGIISPTRYGMLVPKITRNNTSGQYKAEFKNDATTQLTVNAPGQKFTKAAFFFENLSTTTTYQDALDLGTTYANWFQLHTTTGGYPAPSFTKTIPNVQWNSKAGQCIITNPGNDKQSFVIDPAR